MELIFQERTMTLDNPTAADIVENINELLSEQYYFIHFIADGTEIYEDHETYLEQHLTQLSRLEIVAKTVQQFVNDLLLSTESYIQRALPELAILSEAFYDSPTTEAWGQLSDLLEGLQWMDAMLMAIGRSTAVPSNWQAYLNVSTAIQKEIRNLGEALDNEDHVLIGDILQYELIPQFETLQSEVTTTIDNEGTRYDLN